MHAWTCHQHHAEPLQAVSDAESTNGLGQTEQQSLGESAIQIQCCGIFTISNGHPVSDCTKDLLQALLGRASDHS